MKLGKSVLSAFGTASVALLPALLFACSSDKSSSSSPDASTDGSAASGGGANTDSGTGDSGVKSLYARLGGHAGIRAAIDAIVADELKDTEVASFFVFQTEKTPPAGHPTADQLSECLTNQLGGAAGGSETFPGPLDAAHGGFVCRDMQTIHSPFHISGAVFDKFVSIAATTLTRLKVAPADIATIGGVLNSTKVDISDPNAPGGAFTGFADAGADGGSKVSLYERLGGHDGIRKAVEAVVAAELKDSTIAPYFSAQTAAKTPAGHPTADQVEECLTDQLSDAAGGPEVYPLMLSAAHGSWVCRDMITTHKALAIDAADFDKFVGIAATTLTSAGVAPADVTTIGTVLNSTKTEIVTKK